MLSIHQNSVVQALRSCLLAVACGSLGACGGGGDTGPTLDPIEGVSVVANRSIAPWRVLARDNDSVLVYYSATYVSSSGGGPKAGLIPGLSLNRFTGQISGAPAVSGEFEVTVTATSGEGQSDSRSFRLVVVNDQLSANVETGTQAGLPTGELILTASDTSNSGTTAYCIKVGNQVPNADHACFRLGEGGRVLRVPIRASEKIQRHYLFTRNATGAVSAGLPPSAPFDESVWLAAANSTKPVVALQTSEGVLAIELEETLAPKTVENFLKYVEQQYYNSTVFHRIKADFVIQGGGFAFQEGSSDPYVAKLQGLQPPIDLEKTSNTLLSNVKGTVAMARTASANSATSQFFLNTVDNLGLDAQRSPDGNGYAVFGRLIAGVSNIEIGRSRPALESLVATPVKLSTLIASEISMPSSLPPAILYALRIN